MWIHLPTEGHKKKRKNWSENDYYDSDEDDFLDRTGDIERKRRLRKREIEAAKGIDSKAETYESLVRSFTTEFFSYRLNRKFELNEREK